MEVEVKSKTPDCQFNKLLDCPPESHDCNRCGWNPQVMQDRLKRIYSQKNKEEKEE